MHHLRPEPRPRAHRAVLAPHLRHPSRRAQPDDPVQGEVGAGAGERHGRPAQLPHPHGRRHPPLQGRRRARGGGPDPAPRIHPRGRPPLQRPVRRLFPGTGGPHRPRRPGHGARRRLQDEQVPGQLHRHRRGAGRDLGEAPAGQDRRGPQATERPGRSGPLQHLQLPQAGHARRGDQGDRRRLHRGDHRLHRLQEDLPPEPDENPRSHPRAPAGPGPRARARPGGPAAGGRAGPFGRPRDPRRGQKAHGPPLGPCLFRPIPRGDSPGLGIIPNPGSHDLASVSISHRQIGNLFASSFVFPHERRFPGGFRVKSQNSRLSVPDRPSFSRFLHLRHGGLQGGFRQDPAP
ncbi:MAG: hypothetical protein MZV64_63840 [Ignavibacteriales bacterium]|nr:hypothetical protein [Ignavibacteriales bacterium]